jgi:mycothiol system anti-sigma-R factor
MSQGCDHAVEYVYQYIDEELTWIHTARIRWHLKKCVACCGAFGFETRLKTVIRERGVDAPPPELMDRLRALIQEEGSGPPGPDQARPGIG